MEMAWWQWAIGAAAAFSIGIAKTGMPGLGILAVPLMVLAVGDARQSAGWLLPILCISDIFALYYWRRHAAASKLFSLAPWVLLGVGIGAVTLQLSEKQLRPLVGVILAIMLGLYLWRKLSPGLRPPPHPVPYGIAAGFSTTVANAAGPVMSLYFLSKNLPKEEVVATGAWFFFFINLVKIPVYYWQGLFSPQSLRFDAMMIPAALLGAMAGRWLIDHIHPKVFENLVIGLAALSTLLLFR